LKRPFLLIVAALALVVPVALVSRADAAADSTFIFPAGLVCSFSLQVDITGGPQATKTFQAPDGSVRILSAGKGSDLVFTNLATQATYTLSGNGTSSWTKITTPGSSRITLSGHNVVFFFPTDNPAGPSTTLVVGREVIAVDTAGNFTLVSVTGTTTDICAALTA
jgi:hypothetical protein